MPQVLFVGQTYGDIFSIVVSCFQICQGLLPVDLKKRKQYEQLCSESNRFVRILCDQSLVLKILKVMGRHTFWILSDTWYLFLKNKIIYCFKNKNNSLFFCKTQVLIFDLLFMYNVIYNYWYYVLLLYYYYLSCNYQ